jgi:hypothetical protein
MENELDLGGNVAELRPRGFLRYFGALFLAAWLCGWVIGEAVALFGVFSILHTVLFPELLPGWQPPHGLGVGAGSLALLLFLLAWLTLWTMGGVFAFGELLRSLGGVDRIWVEGGDLHLQSGFGPFHQDRLLPRDSVRRVYMTKGQPGLAVATDRGEMVLSRFGTSTERALLADRLRVQLGIPQGEAAVESDQRNTPSGWAVSSEPNGVAALDRDPAARAKAGRVCAVLAVGGLGLGVAWVARAGATAWSPAVIFGLAPLVLFVGLMVCGWLWFAHGADRMLVRHGSLVIERRFVGREWRFAYEPPVLTLEQSVDSDGDEHYRLFVLGAERHRRRLASSLNHARDPLHLGRWIASRTGASLHVPPGLENA